MKPARISAGFTLVELMIVIVLISVIASYAIPSMGSLIENSRRHSAVSDMITLINLARNTAIMDQQTITVCPLDSANQCTDSWNTLPITVFRDPNADRVLAHEDDIVRVTHLAKGGSWQGNTANRPYFRFFASGMASYAIGNLVWCPDDNDSHLAAQIVVNMGGRPRLSEDEDGDGLLEDASGNAVTCS
jgi:type IV fimbrial biogenesis protein FimT